MLLVVTLLRLALNVASARVVLLHGHEGTHAAGRVIQAFGEFVVGGNYAVGFVVFIILTIINFMVVTKGAERVSEVSARFVLDALPGKQMAIDADLNAGVLTREEAKARREEVREEADFYGSMDGASKFIRGDAMAGILILVINILGGLLVGVLQHGLPLATALKDYTLLTIGDGLVAQVPSLLLSTSVAILVTRMSRAQDMSQQLMAQVFGQPRVLIITAAVLGLIGLIPGMPNLHSHAFQRAMAGLTEKGGPQGDSFWSWRRLMYGFLENLTPDDIEVIAQQLYIEMLCAGYTSVAEFHYLHHDPQGRPYANPAETGERIVAAAAGSGIGLSLLPVYYAHGGFGGVASAPGQRRFVNHVDGFQRILEALAGSVRGRAAQRIGVAPHSLRAVTPDELQWVLAAMNAIDAQAPVHIHAAEQQQEVDDCLRWGGTRPVAWLLDNAGLDARWCVVHATHMNADETKALARSGAVAGLCPTTEGDLGDGFFNAAQYLRAGGRIGIGGDSHVGVDPWMELRLFEYGQRLRLERRNVLAFAIGDSLGGNLYRAACAGGAQAMGQNIGQLAPGFRADWVVLNGDDPALAEQSGDGLLDAAVFGPVRRPVRDVMVAGAWRVRDGRHAGAEASLARYRAVMKRLLH